MGFFTNRLIQKKQTIDAEIAVFRQYKHIKQAEEISNENISGHYNKDRCR